MLGQIRKARAAEKDHEELVQRLREAQEQLTQANEELESKVQARTAALCEANTQMEEFAYTVSHDLRAPARSMRGFAVALLEDYGERLDAQGRDFLERIARGGARMGRLIEDILAYSRLGRTEFQLGTVNLDKLVPDIIQQFPEMQLPRAEVAVSYPLGRVVGHDGSMSQAITNLLLNAVKFVAPGVLPKIRVHAEPRGANIRLCVTDNGIGIQPNHQGRLFRVFQRLAVDPSYEGTGMGLAIVKKAAERMGGTVGMQSDGVHGSQFWIEQPAAQQSPVPNATHHTPPALAA
jgi:signal transduction histidine kinase